MPRKAFRLRGVRPRGKRAHHASPNPFLFCPVVRFPSQTPRSYSLIAMQGLTATRLAVAVQHNVSQTVCLRLPGLVADLEDGMTSLIGQAPSDDGDAATRIASGGLRPINRRI